MKLAMYSEFTKELQLVMGDIGNPIYKGDSIVYDEGEIGGLTEFHILLDNEIEAPAKWEEAILLDKRETLGKVLTLEEENAELKKQLEEAKQLIAETNELLLAFMESILI